MMDVAVLRCTWSGSTRYPGVDWHCKHLCLDFATSEAVCHMYLRWAQLDYSQSFSWTRESVDPPKHNVVNIFLRILCLDLPARPARLMRSDHQHSPCRYHFVLRRSLARRHRCLFACYF